MAVYPTRQILIDLDGDRIPETDITARVVGDITGQTGSPNAKESDRTSSVGTCSFQVENKDGAYTGIDLIGKVSGAVIVTTPQEVALLDSRKSVTFCRDSQVPIIGIVENMSGLDCPHCHKHIEVFRKGGGEASAQDMGVPFLGRIPLDPDVVMQSDAGEPYALFNSDTATAQAYHDIANQVEAFCKKSGSLIKMGPSRKG